MKKNASSVACKQKRTRAEVKRDITGLAFAAPYLVNLVVFTLIPMVSAVYYSFTKFNGIGTPEWIGLGNFRKMFFEDPQLLTSLKISFRYAIISVPVRLIAALVIAVIMSYPSKMTNFYRVIYYIPSLIGGGVACITSWKLLWAPDGPINALLENMGMQPVHWLTNGKIVLFNIILLEVWQFGGQMVINLAALKNVPKDLLEAAKVDGATSVGRFFKITLPLITPTIFLNLITGVMGALQTFGAALLITNGGPLNRTLVYGLYQYRQAYVYRNMGYACAMALFLGVIIVSITMLIFKSSSTWVYYRDED